ncbi:MAG: hypothetical protein A2010_06920 [Nitrospirae bacterium GWD2_57_9]|nr:MAG: hypothetical protein A2010_06920 [Nitrospirae bacterium GWD2_57_9]
MNKKFIGLAFGALTASLLIFSCGGGDDSPPAPKYGTVKFVNNSGHDVYYFRMKAVGAQYWGYTHFEGGYLQKGWSATLSNVQLGNKDVGIDYYDGAEKWESVNAFEVRENTTTTFEKTPTSYTVSYAATGGTDGGTGGSCESCSTDATYTNWFNQCASSISQAPCYCASAYLKKCCGDSTWIDDYNTAGQLGTQCW